MVKRRALNISRDLIALERIELACDIFNRADIAAIGKRILIASDGARISEYLFDYPKHDYC